LNFHNHHYPPKVWPPGFTMEAVCLYTSYPGSATVHFEKCVNGQENIYAMYPENVYATATTAQRNAKRVGCYYFLQKNVTTVHPELWIFTRRSLKTPVLQWASMYQCDNRLSSFPTTEYHRSLANTKLYCSETQGRACALLITSSVYLTTAQHAIQIQYADAIISSRDSSLKYSNKYSDFSKGPFLQWFQHSSVLQSPL